MPSGLTSVIGWVNQVSLSCGIRFDPTFCPGRTVEALADLGGMPSARPPPRVQILSFRQTDIENFRNATASGVSTPLRGQCPPEWEILDPPLKSMFSKSLPCTINAPKCKTGTSVTQEWTPVALLPKNLQCMLFIVFCF